MLLFQKVYLWTGCNKSWHCSYIIYKVKTWFKKNMLLYYVRITYLYIMLLIHVLNWKSVIDLSKRKFSVKPMFFCELFLCNIKHIFCILCQREGDSYIWNCLGRLKNIRIKCRLIVNRQMIKFWLVREDT